MPVGNKTETEVAIPSINVFVFIAFRPSPSKPPRTLNVHAGGERAFGLQGA
jgi:hypothetical protein